MEERGITLDIEPEDEPTTQSTVFYNTEMVTNRDISTACLTAVQQDIGDELTVCDALSGSGIRGLRYLNEVPGVKKAILNDSNPAAAENIQENLAENNIDDDRAEIANKDANVLLTENWRSLDYVDLDPFGSPAPYLDSAARSLFREAAIGVTATDLAPLFGSYRRVCERRYAAKPIKNAFSHETGLRILIGNVFTHHSRYDFAFEPLLCHYERHYYRVFGKVRESKKACNRLLEHIGYLQYCRDCGWRRFTALKDLESACPHCSSQLETGGPLWTGKFSRPAFAADVATVLEENGYTDAHNLVDTVAEESLVKTPYYDTHELGSVLGREAPRKQELIETLQDQGFHAMETHFSPKGVRTNAPIETIVSSIDS